MAGVINRDQPLSRDPSSFECMDQVISSASNDDGENCEYHGIKINDLPEEVLAMIFMELDSITREKIKSVCNKWCEILQGVKVLRTHVRLELAELPSRIAYGRSEGWKSLLKRFVTPEAELLHLNGSWKPCDCGSPAAIELLDDVHRLVSYGRTRMSNGKVDFLLTNSCARIQMKICWMENFRRVIIRNSEIFPVLEVGRLCVSNNDDRKWFEELVLNLDDDPHQLSNIYLNDSGPLTKSDNDMLTGITTRFPADCLNVLENSFARVGLKIDLQGLLADVAAGRQIPKLIADTLIGIRSSLP